MFEPNAISRSVELTEGAGEYHSGTFASRGEQVVGEADQPPAVLIHTEPRNRVNEHTVPTPPDHRQTGIDDQCGKFSVLKNSSTSKRHREIGIIRHADPKKRSVQHARRPGRQKVRQHAIVASPRTFLGLANAISLIYGRGNGVKTRNTGVKDLRVNETVSPSCCRQAASACVTVIRSAEGRRYRTALIDTAPSPRRGLVELVL